DVDPEEDRVELGLRDLADTPLEFALVERHDLRDIRDGVLAEPRRLCRQEDVSGGIGQSQIARQGDADDGGDLAAIERVALDHDDGPMESRLRSGGRRQVRPPDLALSDHHSTRRSRRWAADRANSRSSRGAPEYTLFSASVTSSAACRETYSRNAWL